MPNALTTGTTAGSTAKTGQQASAAPAKGVPFAAAAKPAAALDFSTIAYTLAAAQTQVPEIQLQSNGWLEAIEMCFTGTTAANAATVAFQPDAPFCVAQQVTVADPGGAAFFAPHTGYEIYLRNKWEGVLQPPFADARNDPDYSAVTGVGAGLGGSFFFRLWLTFAIRPYDVYCALANGDSGRRYKLDMWLSTIAQLYSTAPTNPPTVQVRGTAHFRLQPPQTLAGQPVQQTPAWYGAAGTARSYWDKVTPALPGGSNASVGVQLNIQGRVIRSIILVARNSAGARVGTNGDGNYPDPITWVFNNYPEFILRDADWCRSMKQCYGYVATVSSGTWDVANGLDTGVRVLHQFMSRNMGFTNPNQNALQWLQTVAGSQVLLQGTFGGTTNSLSALVNDVAPGPNAASMFLPVAT